MVSKLSLPIFTDGVKRDLKELHGLKFDKLELPILKKTMPLMPLFIKDIVDIQPMTAPIGEIFEILKEAEKEMIIASALPMEEKEFIKEKEFIV